MNSEDHCENDRKTYCNGNFGDGYDHGTETDQPDDHDRHYGNDHDDNDHENDAGGIVLAIGHVIVHESEDGTEDGTGHGRTNARRNFDERMKNNSHVNAPGKHGGETCEKIDNEHRHPA